MEGGRSTTPLASGNSAFKKVAMMSSDATALSEEEIAHEHEAKHCSVKVGGRSSPVDTLRVIAACYGLQRDYAWESHLNDHVLKRGFKTRGVPQGLGPHFQRYPNARRRPRLRQLGGRWETRSNREPYLCGGLRHLIAVFSQRLAEPPGPAKESFDKPLLHDHDEALEGDLVQPNAPRGRMKIRFPSFAFLRRSAEVRLQEMPIYFMMATMKASESRREQTST